MPVREILLWPDDRLSQPCAPVAAFDAKALALDLLETMYDADGRGLAAPQVGEMVRMFVMDATWKQGAPMPHVFVDPEILAMSTETVESREGCLSIPGVTAALVRAAEVQLQWTNFDGRAEARTFTGIEAICIQHELDHLDGRVTFDRLSPEDRAALERAYAGTAVA